MHGWFKFGMHVCLCLCMHTHKYTRIDTYTGTGTHASMCKWSVHCTQLLQGHYAYKFIFASFHVHIYTADFAAFFSSWQKFTYTIAWHVCGNLWMYAEDVFMPRIGGTTILPLQDKMCLCIPSQNRKTKNTRTCACICVHDEELFSNTQILQYASSMCVRDCFHIKTHNKNIFARA